MRQARLAVPMTLEELADMSGVSVRAISDLERGRTRRPYPRTVRLLAAALGLSWTADGVLMPPGRTDLGALPGRPTATAALMPPAQLPSRLRTFSGRAAELADTQYREGVADFLVLLDAQRTQLDAEDAVAQAETTARFGPFAPSSIET